MPKSNESLKLYGSKAEQFRDIQEEMEDALGHEPDKSDVVGYLMALWEDTDQRDIFS